MKSYPLVFGFLIGLTLCKEFIAKIRPAATNGYLKLLNNAVKTTANFSDPSTNFKIKTLNTILKSPSQGRPYSGKEVKVIISTESTPTKYLIHDKSNGKVYFSKQKKTWSASFVKYGYVIESDGLCLTAIVGDGVYMSQCNPKSRAQLFTIVDLKNKAASESQEDSRKFHNNKKRRNKLNSRKNFMNGLMQQEMINDGNNNNIYKRSSKPLKGNFGYHNVNHGLDSDLLNYDEESDDKLLTGEISSDEEPNSCSETEESSDHHTKNHKDEKPITINLQMPQTPAPVVPPHPVTVTARPPPPVIITEVGPVKTVYVTKSQAPVTKSVIVPHGLAKPKIQYRPVSTAVVVKTEYYEEKPENLKIKKDPIIVTSTHTVSVATIPKKKIGHANLIHTNKPSHIILPTVKPVATLHEKVMKTKQNIVNPQAKNIIEAAKKIKESLTVKNESESGSTSESSTESESSSYSESSHKDGGMNDLFSGLLHDSFKGVDLKTDIHHNSCNNDDFELEKMFESLCTKAKHEIKQAENPKVSTGAIMYSLPQQQAVVNTPVQVPQASIVLPQYVPGYITTTPVAQPSVPVPLVNPPVCKENEGVC